MSFFSPKQSLGTEDLFTSNPLIPGPICLFRLLHYHKITIGLISIFPCSLVEYKYLKKIIPLESHAHQNLNSQEAVSILTITAVVGFLGPALKPSIGQAALAWKDSVLIFLRMADSLCSIASPHLLFLHWWLSSSNLSHPSPALFLLVVTCVPGFTLGTLLNLIYF